MDQRPQGNVDHSVGSLAALRLEGQTLDSVTGQIGRLAVQSLEGWDAAGASLVTGDEIATYGTTDERINPVDQAQYDSKRGPCVDAIKTGEVQYFDGTSVEPRWRQFAETAADAGVYSTLSFPLRLNDEVIGALNFYSRERDAVRPGNREEGSLFAAQAAVSIANTRAYVAKDTQVANLEDGLQTRTMIGQATGLLMAQEGLTSDEAFDKLVQISQNANIKLREIAKRYVDAWEQRAPTK
ncbi:MAG TPA: GAF and ANTAR domain-containing protein [Actinomycetota bacterium]|nr:GAF and ANTAR domain-containing protein [Actinomycetota bacterium]